MRHVTDRRLILAGCWLALAFGMRTAWGEGTLGYSTIQLVSATQPADDVDPPPAYADQPASIDLPTPDELPSSADPGALTVPNAVPQTPPPARRTFVPPARRAWPELQTTNQTRQALDFYGGESARATLSEMPRRTPIRPASPRPQYQASKPFQTVRRDPTVSPYLNLYRNEEDSEAAPNYFSLVRPQLEQLETNRRQQLELQQLRRQVQNASSTVVGPRYQSSGLPGTGHASRFMDTAQFYSR